MAAASPSKPRTPTRHDKGLEHSRAPTTHTLKPASERFPGITENEAFCMRLAQGIGLNVAPVKIGTIGNRRVC
ncbi:MAG: type II toxin-antitoxin system HipA family toxin [Gammaproteobacteria bacterium]|nr:type II toxin-antitoxin system HipA family toxin [Gammaproteobacteria bacterium]MYH14980.1 type II toxin-antitoxin system HipA family toxin [Gammaproteobacteria bacterium]MYK83299.1 type II toxin-antitoxin system HipA family toxin [Gammaproteobacteria bacterium]